jgi:hypothetical protein
MAKREKIERSRSYDQFKVRFFPHLVKTEDGPAKSLCGSELGTCSADAVVDKLVRDARRRFS